MRAAAVEILASDYIKLDEERLRLEKECREIKKTLDSLKEELQKMVGIAETPNVPLVITIGHYCIAQTLKHREVKAFEYQYVEFKVIDTQKPLSEPNK